MINLKCQVCGKEFSVREFRKDTARCCSYECAGKLRKGKPHLSEGAKKKLSEELTGAKNHSWGRFGDKSYNWSGGKEGWWKVQVLERDDYTCKECGLREPEIMEAHHVIEKSVAPELRFDIRNGETLCPNDHRRKTNQFLRNRSGRRRK